MSLISIRKEVLDKAVNLHGHLGPFLVLGLRMGLKAMRIIGNPTSCEVFTVMKKPYICAVDGLKAIIGDNITLYEGEGLLVRFYNGKDSIVISVKKNILEKYAKTSLEKCEEDARLIMRSSDEELFELLKTN
ncbi:MAG: FmdE family protein [Crenarchaeota archaeon]|nr:FmdE family protein [Thermoproteota archaeon]MDW8033810.1 FmdE family protein [Nitrososphaerota archaeon]